MSRERHQPRRRAPNRPCGADARHRHAGGAAIDASMHYPLRIIVLTFREGCLCTPIQEGLNMRNLRTNLSCLAVLAGIAAVSIAATSGSAIAARACGGGPVC